MSPPIIILSDSDDAPLASPPTIILSNVTPPVSPAIPSDVPSGNASGETEPFEEGEVAPTPHDSFADGPLYRPLIGPMTYDQYLQDQYLQSQQFLAADDCPTPLPSHHSGSDADGESSDSDTVDTTTPTPPPPPPAPARRRKRVRVLEPFEPEPFGKRFKYHPDGPTLRFTARKRARAPPAAISLPLPLSPSPPSSPSPLASPTSPLPPPPPYMLPTFTTETFPPMPPPTVFYSQTTTVPVPPTTSSPIPTPPAVATETVPSPDTHEGDDAQSWSYLPEAIRRWRFIEGPPRVSELGESSTPVLPVTGEPVHHTVPLLAARLVRHEDRIDDIVGVVEEISLERVENMEEEVTNLVVHRVALEQVFQMMGTELEETMDTVTEMGHRLDVQSHEMQDQREISVITQQMLEHQTQELAATTATVHALRVSLEEVRARERARDAEMLGMIRIIRDLERRLGGAPGAP